MQKHREARTDRGLRPAILLLFFALHAPTTMRAQTSPRQVGAVLNHPIQPPAVVELELRHHLMARIPALPAPESADQWIAEAKRIRKHVLEDIAFHGWPKEWVSAPPHFENLGLVENTKGYRLRKLRYEMVPGFQATALLYEPEHLTGKVPAILAVNGHDPQGKAAEYKQKRCINYAKQGMLALSLEWFGYGELAQTENGHDFGAHLDLVGANALGLFYLAMRRGLDYLAVHPNADPDRLGVTGLSGGGWQTIVLGALDERVNVAIPVAGYGSLMSNSIHPEDTEEIEEDATDFTMGQDYTHLTAMRAPRPTLLIFNAEDNCCFRASLVKPDVYDAVKPFFRLFGKEGAFAWHENTDPGTHNYQVDNRQQSYKFFTQHFGLPGVEREIPVDTEIKSYDELAVGLPKDNLTVLALAKRFAEGIKRAPVPAELSRKDTWAAAEREELRRVIRYQPVVVQCAWRMSNTKNQGLETLSYRFELNNGLSATGVWLKAIAAPDHSPATIVLNDKGKKAAGVEVSDRVNRGEQVLALDLLFTGDAAPEKPVPADYAFLVAATGDRPLGLEVAQLIAMAQWLSEASATQKIRLDSSGMRSQVAALISSALEPGLFSEVVVREGMEGLRHLLDAPVDYRKAADLFCLDLYKEFDLDRLATLAEPVKVRNVTEAPRKDHDE